MTIATEPNAHPWMADALCATASMWPETFYPDPSDRDGVRFAKAVCAACPVRADCLEWALDTGDQWAVLGGMSADERRNLRRRQRRAS